MVLDGEAMCFTNAMYDFDKLWSNCFDETVQLCAFDLLELNGEDYRGKPLAERKKRSPNCLSGHFTGSSTSNTSKAMAGASSSTPASLG